jgi:hypothetical protein
MFRPSALFLCLPLVLFAFPVAVAAANPPEHTMERADLVVYGGTASGVITAYSAAREGLHVILLEPSQHVGGMVTGGLSATDVANFHVIGGYARDFFREAAAHYDDHSLDKREDWRSEPHVGEHIFNHLLADAHVDVRLGETLQEHTGVLRSGTRIVSIQTQDGKRWQAKVFADCSYEGELMAQAGVHYTWGRESSAQYGESLAGVRAVSTGHKFFWPVSAYDDQHHLLREVWPGPLAAPGSGDKLVQSYNFRVILTRDPANRLPFPKPDHYDPTRFALLARYLSQFQEHMGRAPRLIDVANPVPIPNHKADFNNNGPVSTDYIGHSWDYPEATYTGKKTIWDDTLSYTKSFFYFIANDPSVPASIRNDLAQWGLPRDEFADSGHWPNQLYIREARRMVGVYVIRQADLQTDLTKPDSIGMGSYNSDSHNIQRVAMPDGSVANEGDVQVHVLPYEIPYRVLLPEPAQATNLLVPVCLSATHAAYSSVRMEPQYMIVGQAAGVAAALAIRSKTAVQDVSIPALQQNLRAHGAILHFDQAFSGPTPSNDY